MSTELLNYRQLGWKSPNVTTWLCKHIKIRSKGFHSEKQYSSNSRYYSVIPPKSLRFVTLLWPGRCESESEQVHLMIDFVKRSSLFGGYRVIAPVPTPHHQKGSSHRSCSAWYRAGLAQSTQYVQCFDSDSFLNAAIRPPLQYFFLTSIRRSGVFSKTKVC